MWVEIIVLVTDYSLLCAEKAGWKNPVGTRTLKSSPEGDRRIKKKGVKRKTPNPLILLVHQEGFGPPTYGFVVRCSIQLSYWCEKIGIYTLVSLFPQGLFIFLRIIFYLLPVAGKDMLVDWPVSAGCKCNEIARYDI
ncbi:MAG: hypothetical protein FD168_2427 [Desulfobulbaceae bacterium]|nr:MAG: hypothetical protein FD168_2427 [Desulfobulbaceae bacterium]